VELTERLSLDPFLAESGDDTNSSLTKSYSLKSIVHHLGSTADSGHYTADALRTMPSEEEPVAKWVSFDDGLTSETTSEAVRNSVQNQKTAYMVLYARD
jgi:uncharacterized UBP type Zn finger protein